eukprot:6752911-Karenia_brevis.AAC.1
MGWLPSNSQWSQATRAFKFAGLGLRSAASHASPAFLASYSTTFKHCKEIDASYEWEGADPNSEVAKSLQTYNAAVAESDQLQLQSAPEQPSRQQTLSHAVDSRQHQQFFNGLGESDRKQLLSETLQGASGFLEAVPSKDSKLAWDPTEFKTEIRIRLLDDIFPTDSWCPACDSVLDKKGRHPAL